MLTKAQIVEMLRDECLSGSGEAKLNAEADRLKDPQPTQQPAQALAAIAENYVAKLEKKLETEGKPFDKWEREQVVTHFTRACKEAAVMANLKLILEHAKALTELQQLRADKERLIELLGM